MRILSWAYLVAIFAFIFLPVVVLVLFSFQAGRLPVPPFDGPSLKWYAEVLGDGDLMAALRNSFFVALVSSTIALTLGFLAAQGLARVHLPGSVIMRGLLIAPMTVSYLIIALGLLSLFNHLGVRPSLWATGIGHVVINLPLCFAILFAAMGDHQKNAERAARDLGASELKVVTLITAPMLKPALLAAFFLSVTFSWDEFIIAFLLTRFDVTLPVEIWSMLRSGLSPATNAIGSLVFLVSIAILIVLELTIFRKSKS
ncbi:MAG: ABC transporter permease [Alphaproteobacteria bacterium]|nr:ABC transporter permease [Alphaproteobacteria bacterium]